MAKHAPTSRHAALLAPLEALVAWGNSLSIDPKKTSMHRLCAWHFHADTAPSVLWLDGGAASAHQEMERTAAMLELAKPIDAALRATGALSMGLRTFSVDLHPANSAPYGTRVRDHGTTALRAHHSGMTLGQKDANRSAKTIVGYMDDSLPILARVPMDHKAPHRSYKVAAYRVSAPTPQAAAALHLAFADPFRLLRVFKKGPASGHQLEVEEIITRHGEYLFSDLAEKQVEVPWHVAQAVP